MSTIEELTAERDAARAELHAERVGRCFDGSQFIRDRLTIPCDMMFARFGKHFSIEDGRAVAKDAAGQPVMSQTRQGERADFDKALAILVAQTGYADEITRRPRGSGAPGKDIQPFTLPDGTTGYVKRTPDTHPAAGLPPTTRGAFEALTPWEQSKWARDGGRIVD